MKQFLYMKPRWQ